MRRRKGVGQFDAENASKRIEAIADLIRSGQIPRREGAKRILREYEAFIAAIAGGSEAGYEEAGSVTYALGVGLAASLAELERRGPVMVRYINGDTLVTLLMPDGPPKGMGG